MKTKLLATLIITSFIIATPAADTTPVTANATNQFTITGMHCDGCAGGLKAELKDTPGVTSASVTFSNNLAVVTYDTNRVSTTQLTKVIKEAGFEGKLIKP